MDITTRGSVLGKVLERPGGWLLLLAGASLIRLLVAASHPLFETECYYWLYSHHLSLGYFDHPPMLGLFLHFLEFWDPPSSLAVRFSSIVCHFFCSVFLYFYGRNLFGSISVGILTGLLFNLIPIYSILAIQNQPDAPLLFFWSATLMCFERSVTTGKGRWWVLTGLAAGGALLSKFHAFPLAGSLVLHLLFFPPDRRFLARPWPYLAGLLALLCYLPNFLWNANNDWITYQFQFARLMKEGEFKILHPIGVLLSPLLLLSPWVYGFIAYLVSGGPKKVAPEAGRQSALPFWSSVPLFVFFLYVSLSDTVKIHWTAPAYIGLLPAVAAALLKWPRRRRLYFEASAFVFTLGVYLYLVFPLAFSYRTIDSLVPSFFQEEMEDLLDKDWSTQNFGFQKLGRFLREEIDSNENPDFDLIASWRFDRAAIAAYYAGLPESAFVLPYGDRRGFLLWQSPRLKVGANVLYVAREHDSQSRDEQEFENLRNCFERIGEPIFLRIPSTGPAVRQFEILPCYGLLEECYEKTLEGDF
jgi:hypothetical protein